MMDQLKEVHLKKWISDLQRAGPKRATYLEITGGIFEARAYLEEIKSKANRRMLVSGQGPTCCVLKQEGGQMKSKIHVSAQSVVSVLLRMRSIECPSYDKIRSKIRFSHIFKEPSSLGSVLQKDSPLVYEFLSLCFELREGLLA
jgi:hypothetical protein